jgi:hypothetical protein
MAAPETTLWSMDRHTQAKHEILRRYLEAWFPILSNQCRRVRIIDGFAGPGEYKDGSNGSPLITLDVLLTHNYAPIRKTGIELIFIEKDPQRSQHLQRLLKLKQQQQPFPLKWQCKVLTGDFIEQMRPIVATMETQRYDTIPTLVFVDPFGFSQSPFHIIQRLMTFPMCEVLINFMAEEINRFLTVSSQKQNFNQLFGTDMWCDIAQSSTTPKERMSKIHDLYRQQLIKKAGATYVRSFEMKNKKNRTDYFLYFATKSIEGLKVMKQAMWKVDSTGAFEFSDCTNPYQPFLISQPHDENLQQLLVRHFKGQAVTPKEIFTYVLVETPYYKYKANALKPLEQVDSIRVRSTKPNRRRYTYPDDTTWITFL